MTKVRTKTIVRALFCAFAAFGAASAGCSRTPADIPFTISTEKPAAETAAEMASRLRPAESAEALVGWLTEASHADRNYARELTRGLAAAYGPDSAPLLMAAVDSVAATLDLQAQAHAMAVAAAPEQLAAVIAGGDAPDGFAEAVEADYAAADTALAGRFHRAMHR